MPFEGLVRREDLPASETVVVSKFGHVGLIEMNEPAKLNPLGHNEMHIHYALHEMHADEQIRAVIIAGRGRAFCAGADFRLLSDESPPNHDGTGWTRAQRLAYRYAFGNLWETMHGFKKPLVAAVQGYCIGGGWELAHMCDFIIAAEDAVFAAVEINMGLIPFASTCNYLTKVLGPHRAADLVMNARQLTASEAEELGLVNRVVPTGALMEEARAVADEVAARPPLAIAACKQLIVNAMDKMEDYDLERALAYNLMATEDTRLAQQSWFNKTKPTYTGR